MNLEHLKVGEKVMYIDYDKWRGLFIKIDTIQKQTKTQLNTGNVRIRRNDGYEIGSSGSTWNAGRYWEEYNQEKIDKYKKLNLERLCDEVEKKFGYLLRIDVLKRLIERLEDKE